MGCLYYKNKRFKGQYSSWFEIPHTYQVDNFLEGDNLVKLGLLLDLRFREVPCIVVVVAVGWPLLGVSVVGVLEFKFDVTIKSKII